jgi:hypothetical protein
MVAVAVSLQNHIGRYVFNRACGYRTVAGEKRVNHHMGAVNI